MIKIVADTGCDIFTLKGASFTTVPLTISTDERTFLDNDKLDTHEMLEYLAAYKGKSRTSCPSTHEWLDAFYNEDGTAPKELYVVTLTSSLSGTYNSACIAKDEFLEKNPDSKAIVIDSLSVGPDMILLLEKLAELTGQGLSFEEVCRQMADYQNHTRLFFGFQSIHNLVQNGRISKLVGAAQSALSLTVMGTASDHGTIESTAKARGEKKVLQTFIRFMNEVDFKGGKLNINHCENPVLAEKLKAEVLKNWPSAMINIYPVRGLCTFYVERGGIVIALECKGF